MSQSISNRLKQALKVLNGTIALADHVPILGEWDVKVVRHDGRIEQKTLRNSVTVTGLNRIAACAVNSAGGVFNSIIVGSATAAPALTDSQSTIGEVSRKTWVVTGANAQSREWIFGVATWGGSADSVTSVALGSAGISIGASSLATSMLANRVNGLGVVLGNSDFLNLTVRLRVGSHDVAHST
jgi:hypothetical protein